LTFLFILYFTTIFHLFLIKQYLLNNNIIFHITYQFHISFISFLLLLYISNTNINQPQKSILTKYILYTSQLYQLKFIYLKAIPIFTHFIHKISTKSLIYIIPHQQSINNCNYLFFSSYLLLESIFKK